MASFRRPSFRCLATCGAYIFDWLRAWVKVKMRSMATPNDHIDMKNRMKATAFATHPICAHICIKSTVKPPSNTEAYRCESPSEESALLQREVHGHGHDDGH